MCTSIELCCEGLELEMEFWGWGLLLAGGIFGPVCWAFFGLFCCLFFIPIVTAGFWGFCWALGPFTGCGIEWLSHLCLLSQLFSRAILGTWFRCEDTQGAPPLLFSVYLYICASVPVNPPVTAASLFPLRGRPSSLHAVLAQLGPVRSRACGTPSRSLFRLRIWEKE